MDKNLKRFPIILYLCLTFLNSLWMIPAEAQNQVVLPTPSKIQYKWHEQERIMLLCLNPCTWQGREYDNHSTPMSQINPSQLNTDQWCETAQIWGAKEILFEAKHTGGFCWWQTETTDYGIKDTPYKNGKVEVLNVALSSRKDDVAVMIK